MCGICGALKFDGAGVVHDSVLQAMNQELVHRGPDDDGFFVAGNVGLAMRRLSIIDLATGHQPLANEDNNLHIVFNGEIYNYKELRADLLQRGHQFRTNSDTETIVHLYEEYGDDCVQHLRGMFAFAIWDQKQSRLFVARDRLGIKPLYYRLTGQEFIFASEVKSLLQYPGVRPELNSAILPEYLAFGYLSGTETFFSGIKALPPGHTMEVEASGQSSVREYWDLRSPERVPNRSKADWIRCYRGLLEECVSSHLMSDVPLGMFLSGGLDSSAVAAIAARLRRDPIDTFSVGYTEAAFSELPYARAVARHIGSQHHEVCVSREEFFDLLPKLIWYEDKPITWPSSVSLYCVARLARERVKVVLTGEGSDETLAGYSRYAFTLWNSRLHSLYRCLPAGWRAAMRQFIAGLASDLRRKLEHTCLGRDGDRWESLYLDNFLCAFSQREMVGLLQDWISGENAHGNSLRHWSRASGDLLNRMLYSDIKSYLVELLMKQDRMSMAASVESRVPFLDHVLVELAAAIPAELKTHKLEGKCVLKAAVQDLLPAEIIYRRKMGFPTPWRAWLSGPQFSWVEQLLTASRAVERRLFKPEAVRSLLSEHRLRKRDHTDRLWRLINLELWCQVFLDAEPVGATYSTVERSTLRRGYILD
jgi:asparagine synthase (glutamine-hydrolysing)